MSGTQDSLTETRWWKGKARGTIEKEEAKAHIWKTSNAILGGAGRGPWRQLVEWQVACKAELHRVLGL
jgi:hypothetical protein